MFRANSFIVNNHNYYYSQMLFQNISLQIWLTIHINRIAHIHRILCPSKSKCENHLIFIQHQNVSQFARIMKSVHRSFRHLHKYMRNTVHDLSVDIFACVFTARIDSPKYIHIILQNTDTNKRARVQFNRYQCICRHLNRKKKEKRFVRMCNT